jgi:hypothetical protein
VVERRSRARRLWSKPLNHDEQCGKDAASSAFILPKLSAVLSAIPISEMVAAFIRASIEETIAEEVIALP